MSGRDGTAGDDADASGPRLPPGLDPRAPRGGLPPRPPRSAAPRQTPAERLAAAERNARGAGARPRATGSRRVVPEQPRRRRAARVLSWLAVVTSVAVLASALGGYLLLNHYDGQLNRIDLGLGADRPADLPRDAKNILIVGSDSRGDLAAGEGTQGTGEDFVTGQRSDTVILAHLYGDSDLAQLVSFPRDSWIEIPAHQDLETGEMVQARNGRLNTALLNGGPSLLIDTIEDLTGVFVDHYMQIDFDGFQTIVNRLDGVEVCLSAPAKEKDSGIDLEAGRQTIKGDQALAFVRQRKGLPRGDIDRIQRQQQFIGAVVRKTLSAGTLLNPLKLNGVINDVTDSLVVDDGLGIGELQNLAFRFRSFNAGGVIFTTAPVADPAAIVGGASVVLLDDDAMAELFGQIRNDIPPATADDAPSAVPTSELIVAPSSVRARVFNGAGVSGLGRQAYDDLASEGFQLVGEPGNRGSGETGTTVFHGPDRADSARTLAAAIPGAVIELDPSLDRTLEVVVGLSYDGTVPVTVTGQPQSAAPAPTTTAPPAVTAAQDPCVV